MLYRSEIGCLTASKEISNVPDFLEPELYNLLALTKPNRLTNRAKKSAFFIIEIYRSFIILLFQKTFELTVFRCFFQHIVSIFLLENL